MRREMGRTCRQRDAGRRGMLDRGRLVRETYVEVAEEGERYFVHWRSGLWNRCLCCRRGGGLGKEGTRRLRIQDAFSSD
jgi:hypothetical protein